MRICNAPQRPAVPEGPRIPGVLGEPDPGRPADPEYDAYQAGLALGRVIVALDGEVLTNVLVADDEAGEVFVALPAADGGIQTNRDPDGHPDGHLPHGEWRKGTVRIVAAGAEAS